MSVEESGMRMCFLMIFAFMMSAAPVIRKLEKPLPPLPASNTRSEKSPAVPHVLKKFNKPAVLSKFGKLEEKLDAIAKTLRQQVRGEHHHQWLEPVAENVNKALDECGKFVEEYQPAREVSPAFEKLFDGLVGAKETLEDWHKHYQSSSAPGSKENLQPFSVAGERRVKTIGETADEFKTLLEAFRREPWPLPGQPPPGGHHPEDGRDPKRR